MDENDLLNRVAAGDEKAFHRLYQQYHQKLGSYIFRLTQSAEAAEELVHDIFLKVWNSRDKIPAIQNFDGYLFIITKNYCLNYLRRQVREKARHQAWEQQLEIANQADDAAFDDYFVLLDQAIDRLPEQQRRVYILSRHYRLKYAEIAAQMQISPETVKKYIQLANGSVSSYLAASRNMVALLLIALNIF